MQRMCNMSTRCSSNIFSKSSGHFWFLRGLAFKTTPFYAKQTVSFRAENEREQHELKLKFAIWNIRNFSIYCIFTRTTNQTKFTSTKHLMKFMKKKHWILNAHVRQMITKQVTILEKHGTETSSKTLQLK